MDSKINYLHIRPLVGEAYCHPSEVVKLRIFHDGHRWNLDGASKDGHWTETCWLFPSFMEAVNSINEFIKTLGIPNFNNLQIKEH